MADNCKRIKIKNNMGAQIGLWIWCQITQIVNDGETSGNISGCLYMITRMLNLYDVSGVNFGDDCTWQADYDKKTGNLILHRITDDKKEEAIVIKRIPDDIHQECRALLKEYFGENYEKGQLIQYSYGNVEELKGKLRLLQKKIAD